MRQGNGAQLSSLLSSLAREEIKRKGLEIAPLGSPMATFGNIEAAEHEGGMLVALADGSVRTLRVGIAESVFWGMVTPAAGEVIFFE